MVWDLAARGSTCRVVHRSLCTARARWLALKARGRTSGEGFAPLSGNWAWRLQLGAATRMTSAYSQDSSQNGHC